MAKNSINEPYILDTSALLTLESASLLEQVLILFSIITTPRVIKELKEFANYEDTLGRIAKRILKEEKKFSLKNQSINNKLEHVSETDEELYNLALKENLVLITDDIKLTRHTTHKIKRVFSTMFLIAFFKAGMLTKEEVLEKLELMRNIRNWKDNIIYLLTKQELEKSTVFQ